MDVLTDLLRQAGLRRRLLNQRRLPARAALRFPCDRSIGLHVVTAGRVYVHAPSLKTPLGLQAGDIALMARGCHHVVSSVESLRGIKVEDIRTGASVASAAPAAGEHAVISGAYQLWNTPVHPFFGQMPAWFVLRAGEVPRLSPLALAVALLSEEVNRHELGSETIVHGLLDVIFGYMVRAMVGAQGEDAGANWSHAVRDPQVHHALTLMHGDCAVAWTLEELARRVGVSRTSLAERFRDATGDTPLNYLRTVRMQKAMRLLSETASNLEQVSLEVGYQDAFSFSKVFKRTVGVAPKEFRRQDAADKALPWRVNER
jgi:AraC-like DNA-binding protein